MEIIDEQAYGFTIFQLILASSIAFLIAVALTGSYINFLANKKGVALREQLNQKVSALSEQSLKVAQLEGKIAQLEERLKETKLSQVTEKDAQTLLSQIDALEEQLNQKEGAILSLKADFVKKHEESNNFRERWQRAQTEVAKLKEKLRG